MTPGGVRADQYDQIGLVEILIGAGHRVGAEGAAMAGDRRRHAQPRIGVDIGRADEALHQLVGDVIILGQQLAGQIEGDRIRPVLVNRVREPVRDAIKRAVPGHARQCRLLPAAASDAAAGRRDRVSRPAPSPWSTAGRNSPDASDRPRSLRRRDRPASPARRSRRRNRGRSCARPADAAMARSSVHVLLIPPVLLQLGHEGCGLFGVRTPCWATISTSARSTSLAMRLASPQT